MPVVRSKSGQWKGGGPGEDAQASLQTHHSMKATPSLSVFAASLISLVSLVNSADGALTVDITEVGGDVVATFSGSLDLTGASYLDSDTNPGGGQAVAPGISSFVLGTSGTMDIYSHMGDSEITAFGVGSSPVYADSSTGDLFACMVFGGSNYNLFLPGGYVFGSTISGTATWNGTTIAGMGLIPDSSHVFTLPADSFTVNVGSSVPEPSTAALLGLFTAAGLFSRRRAVK